MKPPTQKQANFAEKIGVDIDGGLTRSAVSELIEGGLEAERREALTDVPNELAQLVPQPTTDRRKAVIEAYRASGIRIGSVLIRHWPRESPVVVVVVNEERGDSFAKRLFSADGSWNDALRLFSYSDDDAKVLQNEHYALAYNPTTGYRHAIHAAYNIRDMLRQKYEQTKHFAPALKAKSSSRLTTPVALKTFAPLVAAKDKYSNEYGEYWKADVIPALVEDYITSKA